MSGGEKAANNFPERVDIRGAKVYPFASADQLIDFVEDRKGILVAVNAHKLLDANETTLPIINNNIAYCDGAGAVAAAKIKGAQDAVKIAGCELWLKIIERFHDSKTFYIVGAKPAVHEATVAKLRAEFPDIRILGHRDGYLKTAEEREALIADVAEKKPDVVFVAMGSPTQEILMNDMLQRHKAIYQGLGGSFDVYTGNVPRAPRWMAEHKLEFAYRLYKQPKRIKHDIDYLRFVWWYITKQF
ncbi:MAG: WecB/TagA/CpsF family glycosyltransferase [Muribaculaceae bacterium]|nr:WecB/TagA/CpsF family glycosyltransferase [Muribaculaceae bacterium]